MNLGSGIRGNLFQILDPGFKKAGTLILIMAYSIMLKILENISYLRMSVLLVGVLH
jgi:hypothetical protein